MAQVECGERATVRGNTYLAILRRPGALSFSAAGFLGRMSMSMFGLGTVLLVAAVSGRYGLAGTVAAAGAIGYAVCAPQAAKLADRFGQHRVLRPQAVSFAVNTVAFVVCAELRAPLWALLVTGALSGASMPSLGPMVRARWSTLLDDPARLHTAFSLESVADEMIFVIGPAAVTLLATEVYPAAGVGMAMLTCVAGTLLLAAQRRSEPPVETRAQTRTQFRARSPTRSPTRPPAQPPAQPPTQTPTQTEPAGAGRRFAMPARGLITLAPVYLFVGAMFATIDLSTVDFAQRQGHKPLAGVILGIYALGSAIGGLWYGSRTWRARLERRFAVTLCCTAAGVATFWAQPGLLSLTLIIFFCGLTISPTLIAGYGLIERQAPAERRTEGLTWLGSAISIGVAGGSAAAGHIIDVAGPHWGYAFAACCGAMAAAICLLGLGTLRAPSGTERPRTADRVHGADGADGADGAPGTVRRSAHGDIDVRPGGGA
ncbi:MAG: MFS transporter [Streptosporangiaceae bacterium]